MLYHRLTSCPMKLWPTLRETIISTWHSALDYDRKITKSTREARTAARAAAREKRLAADQSRLDRTTAKARISAGAAALKRQDPRGIAPEDVEITTAYPRREYQPTTPRVTYIAVPQPAPAQQTVIVKTTGCADGCVIVIAVVIIITLIPVGCSVLGLGMMGKAVEYAEELRKQEAEQEKARRENLLVPPERSEIQPSTRTLDQ